MVHESFAIVEVKYALSNLICLQIKPVANLIKYITIVNYDARVVLTTNLPILRP